MDDTSFQKKKKTVKNMGSQHKTVLVTVVPRFWISIIILHFPNRISTTT